MTTSANFAGLAREALIAASGGEFRVAGIAREALISGKAMSGTMTAQSACRGSLFVLAAGVVLIGRITARSGAKSAVGVSVALTARAAAHSMARAVIPTQISVSGRISATSRAGLVLPGATVLTAKSSSRSRLRGALTIILPAATPGGAVTVING